MASPAKNRERGNPRTATRDREWVRLHVLEGKTFTEIGRVAGFSETRVREVISSPAMKRFGEELLDDHARAIRGRVAAMADAAAKVMASHLDPKKRVPHHVRSKAATFVLEKTVSTPPSVHVSVAVNPQVEFFAWLGELPKASSEQAPMPAYVAERLRSQHPNGNGNGSSSSAG